MRPPACHSYCACTFMVGCVNVMLLLVTAQASRALKNMANKFPSTFHPEHYNFDYVSDFDDRTAFVASWLSNLDIAQPSELAPSSSNAASAPPSSKGDSVQ